MKKPSSLGVMPAEWEPHRATWIAWRHEAEDWPGKFETIDWVYAEIVRALGRSELVEIIVKDPEQQSRAKFCLDQHRVSPDSYRFHTLLTNRSWLRDSGPTLVRCPETGERQWIRWRFNAWAKYDNFELDAQVPELVSEISKLALTKATKADGAPFVLEGGAIDTDGQGTVLVTLECLQSEIQCRNPGMSCTEYEELFFYYLGVEKTIWLAGGCEGDDTHGHIDDVARFVAPRKVLLAFEEDPTQDFYRVSVENEAILRASSDSRGEKLEVVRLPMPEPIFFGEDRLPASYANFYVANRTVLVPTFNDPNDLKALTIIQSNFPDREVVGIAATDLVLGFGTLHCLTQQEPL